MWSTQPRLHKRGLGLVLHSNCAISLENNSINLTLAKKMEIGMLAIGNLGMNIAVCSILSAAIWSDIFCTFCKCMRGFEILHIIHCGNSV